VLRTLVNGQLRPVHPVRLIRRMLVIVGTSWLGAVGVPLATGAQSSSDGGGPLPVFNGSAAADGFRVRITQDGGTLTESGGPTAQVAVNSLSSMGYAAFPDPGETVVLAPGLVAGVLAQGPGGLPPIHLPFETPAYPLYVASDATTAPDQSMGSGPYEISASSRPESSTARATGGFQSSLNGSAALVTSTASVSRTSGGNVVAEGVAEFHSLSIGPLVIGNVKSVATMTLDAFGTVTPSTALEIAGLRIGGVPVSVREDGVVAGPATHELGLNSFTSGLLKDSGVSVEVVSAQSFPDRVLAPTLKITFPYMTPVEVPKVGRVSGTGSLMIGLASASLVGVGGVGDVTAGGGSEVSPAVPTAGTYDPEVGSAPVAGAGTPAFALNGSLPDSPTLSEDTTGDRGDTSGPPVAVDLPLPERSQLSAPPPGMNQSAGGIQGRRIALLAGYGLDVGTLYLLVAAGGIVAWAAGLLVRLLSGVRS
jgi:hypothetical protein